MEELKVIVNLIQQLGVEGKEAFIWWLLMDKGLSFVLSIVVTLIGFSSLTKIVLHLFGVRYLQDLRDLMGVGSPGNITIGEINEMISWITKHKG